MLRAEGFRQFRVRVHGLVVQEGEATAGPPPELVRIEVERAALERLVVPELRERIVAACRAEGFAWITLDLEGYRTGSTSVLPTA
jgi:uncharacterized protein